jgi:hypothetical protein
LLRNSCDQELKLQKNELQIGISAEGNIILDAEARGICNNYDNY